MELTLDQEIERLEKQEASWIFEKFDHKDALAIGMEIVSVAERDGLPIEVDIELAGHCLFHCALSGTTAENTDWIRRKKNMIHLAGSSSLLAYFRLEKEGKTLIEKYPAVNEENCCASGGGLPIRIAGKQGIPGQIIVSGLPHTEDHALVARAIEAHLRESIN